MAFFPTRMYRVTEEGVETLGYLDMHFRPAFEARWKADMPMLEFSYNLLSCTLRIGIAGLASGAALWLVMSYLLEQLPAGLLEEGAYFNAESMEIVTATSFAMVSLSYVIRSNVLSAMTPLAFLRRHFDERRPSTDFDSSPYQPFTRLSRHLSNPWEHGVNNDYLGRSIALPPNDAPQYFWELNTEKNIEEKQFRPGHGPTAV